MNALLERPDTIVPTAKDAEMAATASRVIAKTKDRRTELRVRVNDTELALPCAAKDLLIHLLKEIAQGNAVTLIPVTRRADQLRRRRTFSMSHVRTSSNFLTRESYPITRWAPTDA